MVLKHCNNPATCARVRRLAPFARAHLSGRSNQLWHRADRLRTRAVEEVSQDDFEEKVVKSEVPVMVEFWASWCGPCKLIDPLLKELDAEHQGRVKIAKIECDSNKDIVEKYEIYGLPSFLLFKDGKADMGSKYEGALGMKGLKSWMESNGAT